MRQFITHDALKYRLARAVHVEASTYLSVPSMTSTTAQQAANWVIDNPAGQDIKARPANTDVNSPESFELAKAWLNQCREHPHCPVPESAPLPTRNLDTLPSMGPPYVQVRLGGREKAQFVALSYVCGSALGVTSISSNLTSHEEGITVDSLSQTIQDAIFFTRQLGLRYLWKDPLCIVQDSIDEKQREISVHHK